MMPMKAKKAKKVGPPGRSVKPKPKSKSKAKKKAKKKARKR
jgi:hypothetical protein